MFYPFVDQLSIFHLPSITYCRRRVNEPFKGGCDNELQSGNFPLQGDVLNSPG